MDGFGGVKGKGKDIGVEYYLFPNLNKRKTPTTDEATEKKIKRITRE